MRTKEPKTILVVKNRAIGDSVIGLSTIQYLKNLFPKSRIIYAVPSWIAPLFSRVETAADEIYPLQLKTPFDWFTQLRQLKKRNPDIVFEMFQSGRTKKFFTLFPKPYLAHNHHINGHIHDQGTIKPNIQRDLDGAWSFFSSPESTETPSYLDYTPFMGLPLKKREKVTLGVVATRSTKMWSLENYIQLIRIILSKSPNTTIQIPLSTSPQDREIKRHLIQGGAPEAVEFLEVPLAELPHHLNKSKIYIGNDTGLKHICVALGVKTYTLFGPEPPLEWHPYSPQEHPYFFHEPLVCRTQLAHYCGLSQCETMDCLNIFTPQKVWEKIEQDLQ